MRKFIIKLLLVAPLVIAVLGFNIFVDPVHLTDSGQYERGIAKLILSSQSVTNITNPNEEAYLTTYIDGLREKKDVLVLGSSRSKLIRSTAFSGKTFFNNSIGGASLTDYMAIYDLYRRRGYKPSTVVIELSPWVLDKNYASFWKSFNNQRDRLEADLLHSNTTSSDLPHISFIPEKYSDLLSIGYFQTSFFTWLRRITTSDTDSKEHTSYFVFDYEKGDIPVNETLLYDGSTVYPERVRKQVDEDALTAAAIAYGEKPIVPNEIDSHQQTVLEAFTKYLIDSSVEVIFYLPPYHPKTYEIMVSSEHKAVVTGAQNYFRDLAARTGARLIGSYNPADLHMNSADFFDGSHPTDQAIRGLFSAALPNQQLAASGATAPTPQIRIVGVNNPNGLEVLNSRPFFWIGSGDTCLDVRSSQSGAAVLHMQMSPGPSLPETQERRILVHDQLGNQHQIAITNYPNVSIDVQVEQGIGEVCLTPLDRPSTALVNGDKRPLLIGVSDASISLQH
jgi:hypothetical protein